MSSANKFLIDEHIDPVLLSTKVDQFMHQLDQYVDLKSKSITYKQKYIDTQDIENKTQSKSCK